jgi:protein-ribulosamine 3-kinase
MRGNNEIALPLGWNVVDVTQHGSSSWSTGYKLILEKDDEETEYFLKVCRRINHLTNTKTHCRQVGSRPQHAAMALGEYESQKALSLHLPHNSVVPIAYGTFSLDPSKSFFLTTYRELKEKTPDPVQLVHVLAKLHKGSASPTGMFGFHVTTFNGHVPLRNEWCASWEEWYGRQLRSDIEWEQSVRGADTEFNSVAEEFFEKVVPRLLRPLQSSGRSIKPTLVHGDLWHGNAQVDMDTKQVILFDSCCCYAHNECKQLWFLCGEWTDIVGSGVTYDEAAAIPVYAGIREPVQADLSTVRAR